MDQGTYTRLVHPAAKLLRHAHVVAYRATRRRVGSTWLGGEIVFLTTTGRRSGRRRIAPLAAIRDHQAVAVVASNGGSDRVPDWWLNLQHDPRAEIECGGMRRPTWGTRAERTREARLLADFARTFPNFERYRRRTTRELPVILLTPLPCRSGSI